MKSRTFRLLVVALGIGSMAGWAAAQDADSPASNDTGGYASRNDAGESEATPAPARIHRAMSSPADRSEEGEAPRGHSQRHAPFSDDSGFRSRHVQPGPDPDLAQEEMTRLSNERHRTLGRGARSDEVHHVDTEMDRLDDSIGMQHASSAERTMRKAGNDASDDAPMRKTWRRDGQRPAPHHKTAPVSEDPAGDEEQVSAHSDPRHAYRPHATKNQDGDEASHSAHHPVASDENDETPHASRQRATAEDGDEKPAAAPAQELLGVERQLTLMRRKGAPAADIEALESRASKLRLGWHDSLAKRQPDAAPRSASGRFAREETPSEPAPPAFWHRGDRAPTDSHETSSDDSAYHRSRRAQSAPSDEEGAEEPAHEHGDYSRSRNM